MNRRSTLKFLVTGGALVTLGGGYHWLTRDRVHSHLAVDLAVQRLESLKLDNLATTGAWETARTFDHLAQSVEFSMTGYPVMKSDLFQNTAGKLAFSVFQASGRMKHGLDEAIPGEIVKTGSSDPAQARNRLLAALADFEKFEEPLEPHFAYGKLDKQQYALAHVMHVNNHLEEFTTT